MSLDFRKLTQITDSNHKIEPKGTHRVEDHESPLDALEVREKTVTGKRIQIISDSDIKRVMKSSKTQKTEFLSKLSDSDRRRILKRFSKIKDEETLTLDWATSLDDAFVRAILTLSKQSIESLKRIAHGLEDKSVLELISLLEKKQYSPEENREVAEEVETLLKGAGLENPRLLKTLDISFGKVSDSIEIPEEVKEEIRQKARENARNSLSYPDYDYLMGSATALIQGYESHGYDYFEVENIFSEAFNREMETLKSTKINDSIIDEIEETAVEEDETIDEKSNLEVLIEALKEFEEGNSEPLEELAALDTEEPKEEETIEEEEPKEETTEEVTETEEVEDSADNTYYAEVSVSYAKKFDDYLRDTGKEYEKEYSNTFHIKGGEDLVEEVKEEIKEYGIPEDEVSIEMTTEGFINDTAKAARAVLRKRGGEITDSILSKVPTLSRYKTRVSDCCPFYEPIQEVGTAINAPLSREEFYQLYEEPQFLNEMCMGNAYCPFVETIEPVNGVILVNKETYPQTWVPVEGTTEDFMKVVEEALATPETQETIPGMLVDKCVLVSDKLALAAKTNNLAIIDNKFYKEHMSDAYWIFDSIPECLKDVEGVKPGMKVTPKLTDSSLHIEIFGHKFALV